MQLKFKFKKIIKLIISSLIIAVFVFFVFGFNLGHFFPNILNALKGPKTTIKLGLSDINLFENNDNYQIGWWNIDKGLNKDLSKNSFFIDFSEENSVFYKGGDYSLILSGFGKDNLRIDKIEEALETDTSDEFENSEKFIVPSETSSDNIEEAIQEDQNSLEPASVDSENLSEETVNLNEEESQEINELQEQNNLLEQAGLEIVTDSIVEDLTTESLDTNAESQVEIIQQESEPQEIEVMEIEQSQNSTEVLPSEELSLFGTRQAQAADDSGLAYMGEFESATLKFSMAAVILSKPNLSQPDNVKVENNEGAVIDEDASIQPENAEIEDGGDNIITEEIYPLDIPEENEDTEVIYNNSIDPEINSDESKVEIIEEAPEVNIQTEESQQEASPEENNINLEESVASDELSWLNNLGKKLMPEAKAQSNATVLATLWYSLGETGSIGTEDILWQRLSDINLENFSNGLHGDYFSYEAPFLKNWSDVEKLQIKLEGKQANDDNFVFYLDSAWVEADFYQADDYIEPEIEEENNWQGILEELAGKDNLYFNDEGEFRFKFNKKNQSLLDNIGNNLGWKSFWDDIDIEIELYGPDDKIVEKSLAVIFDENGEFLIKLPELKRKINPGQYKLKFLIHDKTDGVGDLVEIERPFTWGVLAMNTNKSVYGIEDESAYIQMGVLDNFGHTICDADLILEILEPSGMRMVMSTEEDSIVRNELCGMDNIIDTPDYYTHYMLYGPGRYEIKLTSLTEDGARSITDHFEVRESLPFSIERIGPTRINPVANYEMRIIVIAEEDFQGDILEKIPESFGLENWNLEIENSLEIENWKLEITGDEKEKEKQLRVYGGELLKGQVLKISYQFDAPNISPELFLLGPLSLMASGSEEIVFEEIRPWQIASDAFEYIAYSNGITSSGWTNAGYAWDYPTNNLYATHVVEKQTSGGDISHYIQGTISSSTIDKGGDITAVRVGIEGYVGNTALGARVQPRFNSGVDVGTAQLISGAMLGTTPNVDTIRYITVTGDAAGPGAGNWTWEAVRNMYVRVYGDNTSNSRSYTLSIDQIWIEVTYTPNNAPTSTVLSIAQRPDTSGVVDVSAAFGDLDFDNLRARVDYAAGSDCNFGTPLDPYLDETDSNATSTWDDAKVYNSQVYQIGSSTGWITMTTGSNAVHFDWLTLSTAGMTNADGTYCVRITASDFDNDQITPATSTVVIDNKAPTAPGALTGATTTKNSIILKYGATTTESHFLEYRIYYKESDGTAPAESDTMFASTSDINLYDKFFNNQSTTTITAGIEEGKTYSFNIWAYDTYGRVSSSSYIDVASNRSPTSIFNSALQRSDGSGVVDISIDINDLDTDDETMAKLEYEQGSDCSVFTGDSTLDETQSNISSTHGLPTINNLDVYQISNIDTPASNTIEFDWFAVLDTNNADDTYCLKLTANDGKDDQTVIATTTLTLDSKKPTAPGQLSAYQISTSSIILNFGATTTETNFYEYKIYYKIEDGTPPTETDILHGSTTDINLFDKFFNLEATTTVGNLSENTYYSFNIWAYDQYGNKASSSSITIRTNAFITNNSLTFTNPDSLNYAIADGTSEWNFQAVVSEENGYAAIDYVLLRLADNSDDSSPFEDLEFTWDQTTDQFLETGSDIASSTYIAPNSSSVCAGNTCTLNFSLVFNHNFASSSWDYDIELYSINDSAVFDEDSYADIY